MLRLPRGVRYGLLSQTMLRTWTRCAESGRRRTRTWFPMAASLMSLTCWDKTWHTDPTMKAHCGDQQVLQESSCAISLAEGSTRIRSFSATKWNWKGQLIYLDSTYYIKFIQDHPDEVACAIVQKIMDMNMFRQARDLANMLLPVTTALDLGQSDKTTIADACNIFMNLLNSQSCKITATKSRRGLTSSSHPATWLPTCFTPSTWVPGWSSRPRVCRSGYQKSWSCPHSSHCFPSRGNLFSSFLLHHQRPGQQSSDMVDSLGLIIKWSPRWLHRLHGDATVCSGIIFCSGTSRQ